MPVVVVINIQFGTISRLCNRDVLLATTPTKGQLMAKSNSVINKTKFTVVPLYLSMVKLFFMCCI